MTQKLAVAYVNTVKSSPIKVMRITKNIVGRPVAEVLKLLQFSNLKLAPIVRAVVYSAMSNAENNHNMDVDNLYVKDVDVGRAFALRRFAARGRGKSSRILKTFSNIRVILAEKSEEKTEVKKQKTKTKE
jgi:large subunit ribosomal protein L22